MWFYSGFCSPLNAFFFHPFLSLSIPHVLSDGVQSVDAHVLHLHVVLSSGPHVYSLHGAVVQKEVRAVSDGEPSQRIHVRQAKLTEASHAVAVRRGATSAKVLRTHGRRTAASCADEVDL